MSFDAQRWARSVDCGSGVAKCVLFVLVTYADEDGLCWPSQETIASDANFSLRAVRGAIASLRDMGLITCTKRRRMDGSRRSDDITLQIGAVPKRQDMPVVSPQQAGGATQAACDAGHELPGTNQREEKESARASDAACDVPPPIEVKVVAGEGVIETTEGYRPAAPVQPLRDVRTLLDTEGVALIQEMTGRSEFMARKLIDRFLTFAFGEANIVLAYLREAKSRNETDPSMWVEDQLRARNLKTREPVVLPGGGGRFYREKPNSGMTQNLIEIHERVAARSTRVSGRTANLIELAAKISNRGRPVSGYTSVLMNEVENFAADDLRGDSVRIPGSDPDEIIVVCGELDDEPEDYQGEIQRNAYASDGGSVPTDAVLCEEENSTSEPRDRAAAANQVFFPENAFDMFWHMYPERVGILSAQKAFEAVRSSGRVAFRPMMEGLARYKATKPKRRAWCNPTKWLEEGRWDDRIAPGQDNEGRRPSNGFSELAERKVSGDDSIYRDPYEHLDRPGFGRAG